MVVQNLATVILLFCYVVAQRSPYAGQGPLLGLLPRFRPNETELGNRNGFETSTPLPDNLQGTLEEDSFVHRVSEWPEDKHPFWFKNRELIKAQRERPADGSSQQSPRPRPPFAGGQQSTQTDRFQSAQPTGSDDGELSLEEFQTNERPSGDTFGQTNSNQRNQQTESDDLESSSQQSPRTRPPFAGGQQSTQTDRFQSAQQTGSDDGELSLVESQTNERTNKFGQTSNQRNQQTATGARREEQQFFNSGANSQTNQQRQTQQQLQTNYEQYEVTRRPSYQNIQQSYANGGSQLQNSYRPWGKTDIRQQNKLGLNYYGQQRGRLRQHPNHDISSLFSQDQERSNNRGDYKRKPSPYREFIQKPQMR